MNDFIELYPATLDPETCEALIGFFEGNSSKIASSTGIGGRQNEIRRSTGVRFGPEGGELFRRVYSAISQRFAEFCKKYEDLGRYKATLENFGIYRYQDSTERYGWHFDSCDAGLRYRFASIVLYLNTVEEGGETEFKYFNRKVKPEAGTLVLFPAGWTHVHQALPPLKGRKYVLITWVRYADTPKL